MAEFLGAIRDGEGVKVQVLLSKVDERATRFFYMQVRGTRIPTGAPCASYRSFSLRTQEDVEQDGPQDAAGRIPSPAMTLLGI